MNDADDLGLLASEVARVDVAPVAELTSRDPDTLGSRSADPYAGGSLVQHVRHHHGRHVRPCGNVSLGYGQADTSHSCLVRFRRWILMPYRFAPRRAGRGALIYRYTKLVYSGFNDWSGDSRPS